MAETSAKQTWSALATVLGVPRQSISAWRKRAGFPSDPDEVAVRLWHETAKTAKRRGPAMAELSAPSDEVLAEMRTRRPRGAAARPVDHRDRKDAALATLAEINARKALGELIERDQVEREAQAEARALLMELVDLPDRVIDRLAFSHADCELVREAFDDEIAELRDRLAGVAATTAWDHRIATALSQLGLPDEPHHRQILEDLVDVFDREEVSHA